MYGSKKLPDTARALGRSMRNSRARPRRGRTRRGRSTARNHYGAKRHGTAAEDGMANDTANATTNPAQTVTAPAGPSTTAH
ncbi:twin-arginine translocase TatA/TatE family subunit [Streptomyces sp. NPDC058295]|uniref:twin-arginine translocase TatA/TatE family subunit n=1 Tax=Streptomyces sp. NPDC058295 TaxID=3346431 RepID=UPI0036EFEDF0